MLMPSNSAAQFPADVLTAAAHSDPYPYYAALLAYRPLYREHRLNLWIALGAEVVSEVLSNPRCRVRPTAEPVPAAIAGAPAGHVFGHLVRMNDGPDHAKAKTAVSACLAGFDPTHLVAIARREASVLARDVIGAPAGELDRFNLALPVRVVARMIGLAPEPAARCVTLIGDFVRCLSPLSSPAEIARSNDAAASLLDILGKELRRPQRGGLAMQAERLRSLGIDNIDAVLANLVGFLSQTYEATAGLIGNTLLALARDSALCRHAAGDDSLLHRVIEEVARHDPPVHNTRRFLAQDDIIAGEAMKAGDQILVVLAAANRDPAHCARPHAFDPDRPDRSSFTFGAGRHACAGAAIAINVAEAGIQALLAHGLDVAGLAGPVEYRRSVNSRIPLFGGAA